MASRLKDWNLIENAPECLYSTNNKKLFSRKAVLCAAIMCIIVEAIGQQHDPKEWRSRSWVSKICYSIMKINTLHAEDSYNSIHPEGNSERSHFSVVYNYAAQHSVDSSANGIVEHGRVITQINDDNIRNHWFQDKKYRQQNFS